MEAQKSNKFSRFQSIDGMRGVAALSVVFYHLGGNLQPELDMLLPDFISVAISYGYLGVPVFFVISGFVISLGIGSSKITPRYFGNFILRRSVRLDVTYWASIFFALILVVIKNKYLGSEEQLPSITVVLYHMFYLQELLAVDPVISVVYWTLCMEVQLYLFYITSLWISQKILVAKWLFGIPIHLYVMIILGVYSILLDLGATSIPMPGVFISNWHYFLMGVLVSNVVRRMPFSVYVFIGWIFIEIAFQFGLHVKAYTVAGIAFSFLIFSLWKMDCLNRFLVGKVFKYLGAMSYTLYLVHPDIGWKVISLGKQLLAEYNSPIMSGVLLLLGVIASILVANLFHIVFEKPSLWVCQQLKTMTLLAVLSKALSLIRASKIALLARVR